MLREVTCHRAAAYRGVDLAVQAAPAINTPSSCSLVLDDAAAVLNDERAPRVADAAAGAGRIRPNRAAADRYGAARVTSAVIEDAAAGLFRFVADDDAVRQEVERTSVEHPTSSGRSVGFHRAAADRGRATGAVEDTAAAVVERVGAGCLVASDKAALQGERALVEDAATAQRRIARVRARATHRAVSYCEGAVGIVENPATLSDGLVPRNAAAVPNDEGADVDDAAAYAGRRVAAHGCPLNDDRT